AAALANAKAKGIATEKSPAWRFTLQMPSMLPLMQHLDDDDIRRQVWEASVKVAAEGDRDNTSLVWNILRLRQEKAEILGHSNFADLTLQRRMARNGATALKFTENLHDRIESAFREEYRSLCDYKARKTGTAVD